MKRSVACNARKAPLFQTSDTLRCYKIYLCFYVVIICVSAHIEMSCKSWPGLRDESLHTVAGLSSVW